VGGLIVDVEIDVCGEMLTLMPERAVYWGRTRTLFIADTHFGKMATFRAYGIPLPDGGLAGDLARLTRALERSGADKLIVLGDLLHAAKGRDEATLTVVAGWRAEHTDIKLILVRGNHDVRAGDPPAGWDIEVVNAPTRGPLFVLSHAPMMPEEGYALAGHLHPAALLVGKGRQTLKLPCFWFGERCAVLPAFSSFVDGGVVQPKPGDQVFVATGEKVLRV
jgi:DNA ligase-associated metallophosphoesterase